MKIWLLILTLPLLEGCGHPFLKVISSSFSKEFCSCYFVVNQSQDYCSSYAEQIIPVNSFKIDLKEKTIESKGLGFSTTAKFFGGNRGCEILNDSKLN